MRKEGDDVGVAVPPGCVEEGYAEGRGPFLVTSRLMNVAVFASTVKKRFKGFSSFVLSSFSLRAPEIVLPTKAHRGYVDHIWRFRCLGDRRSFWQVTRYSVESWAIPAIVE